MNHLGSSTWAGDSDMNTSAAERPDYGDPRASYISPIWCTSCRKILLEGREQESGECDFCVRDRIEEARYRQAENDELLREQIELHGHGWGPLATQAELPF